MDIQQPKLKTVLITGATRGIGAKTAELFLQNGYTVFGTSRKPDENKQLFSHFKQFKLLYLDLSDSTSIASLPEQTGSIDLLINNAGVSQIGAAEDITQETSLKIFKTNFLGIVELNKCYLPRMRNSGFGRILHISSLAAKIPLPYSALYAASKAALEAYSSALRVEVKKFNIGVTSIYFDYVKTTLPQIESINEDSPYYQSVIHMKKRRDDNMEKGRSASEVAHIIYKTSMVKKTPSQVCIGNRTKLRSILKKILPDFITERIIQHKFNV